MQQIAAPSVIIHEYFAVIIHEYFAVIIHEYFAHLQLLVLLTKTHFIFKQVFPHLPFHQKVPNSAAVAVQYIIR
jgi:hypothetical protein